MEDHSPYSDDHVLPSSGGLRGDDNIASSFRKVVSRSYHSTQWDFSCGVGLHNLLVIVLCMYIHTLRKSRSRSLAHPVAKVTSKCLEDLEYGHGYDTLNKACIK
jgi:hypothetical protein